MLATQINSGDRVRGLDSIRFICALWVFFGHGAARRFASPFPSSSLSDLIFRGFYNNIWSGPAAVIVFFVISGFCIHYPFAGSDKRPRLKEFYARRFLRLLIPLSIAVPLSGLLGVRLTLFQDSILWSLFAELTYYLCYPVLRIGQLRFGSWRLIIAASFAGAFALAAQTLTQEIIPLSVRL
jgi:peptidoglycan/LPS O-acetylase OafA/YrhL